MIILGIIKYYNCHVNLMRNEIDFSVYINISQEFDVNNTRTIPDECFNWEDYN